MKTAAVTKLKAMLSEYIDYVRSGEEILVTYRGKPVAMITPVGGGVARDAKRAELARRGIIRPGKGPISREIIESLPGVNVSQKEIERIIDDEREDRI
jgi:prevent-host-death family protein